MFLRTSRIFCLLLAVLLAIVFLSFILSWVTLAKIIRWTAVSRKSTHTVEYVFFDTNVEFWDNRRNSNVAVSTKTKPVSTPVPDRMKTPTRAAETPMAVLSIKSFNKLPQWDFEDVYNQDAPPRHSKCAHSLQNSEDESFKKVFLPNIRLFLHKDNINMSEWNRLSHFNNPFGFMGCEYDDVMASVKLIPKPKEPLLLPKSGGDGCVRCAVVGTAGILSGSKMGREIDAHDYVFRMNGAIIKGFEEDVGSRTSVFIHTAHSITASLYFFKKHGYTSVPKDEGIKFVMIPEGLRDFYWLEGLLKGERVRAGQFHNQRPRTFYSGQFNESRFYVLHQDFLRYVRNRFLMSSNLNSTYWAMVRPTNGAFTLFVALHTCDVVSAYGFMTEDYKKYSNHYFERNMTKVIFYINHDYILEKNLWAKLHKSKIIHLYQRTTETVSEKKLKDELSGKKI